MIAPIYDASSHLTAELTQVKEMVETGKFRFIALNLLKTKSIKTLMGLKPAHLTEFDVSRLVGFC
ncbi:MAG: hypothetical protein QW158_07830 [Nitrososphaerales archaeon]